jgi:hypothetical protein
MNKSISTRWRSPRPNPAKFSSGLDEDLAWGAPKFQPSPRQETPNLDHLTYFKQIQHKI